MPLPPTPPPAIISQAFMDRAARTQARVEQAASQNLLAPGQQPLLAAQLDVAKRAYAARDPLASPMLDVIDRQLAQADHLLTHADDGYAITVHVGDTVTIALHDQYFWNVSNSDQTALAPKIGVMWARGVQGAFTAKQPGTAILSLTSRDPAPPTVKQPLVFTVTILPQAVK
jgi:hypothetical protein